jgi:hypothetical protein
VLDLAAPHSHHPPDQIHIMVTKTRPGSVGASPLTSSHVQSTPYILGLKHETPTLHCLRSAPDETTIIRDLRVPGLTATTEGRFPTARGPLGHRLFISAFMVASKVICDDTYTNKSWSIVGQVCFSCERSIRWSARRCPCSNIVMLLGYIHPEHCNVPRYSGA